MTIEQQIESDVLVRLGSQLNSEAVSAAAELRDQDALHDGTLRGVRLIGANLQGADLSGADLREARLFGMACARTGWPAMHHSEAYRTSYTPAYRVLTAREAEALLRAQDIAFEAI